MEHKLLNQTTRWLLGISLIGYLFFYIFPLGMNVYFSVIEYGYEVSFVGFHQYSRLFQDELFKMALKNNVLFISIALPLGLILAYVISRILTLEYTLLKRIRFLFLVPILLPTASLTYTWELIFRQNGFMNQWFLHCNAWENKWQDLMPMILLFVWKNTGYAILIFMAGFLMIPKEVYEAASLEGASRLGLERYITLPMMRGPGFLSIVIGVVQALKIGRESYILYGERSKDSIYMLPNYFREQFMSMNVEKMSSAAIIFSILIMGGLGYLYKLYKERER